MRARGVREGLVAALFGVLAVLGPIALDQVATGRARDAIARRIGARLGAKVRVERLRMAGAFRMELEGVVLRWPGAGRGRLRAEALDVEIAAGSLLRLRPRLAGVHLRGGRFEWIRPDAVGSLRRLVARLRRPRTGAGRAGRGGARTALSVELRSVEIRELGARHALLPTQVVLQGARLERGADGRLRGRLRQGRLALASAHRVELGRVEWRGRERRGGGLRTHRLRVGVGRVVSPQGDEDGRRFTLVADELVPDLLQVRLSSGQAGVPGAVAFKAAVDGRKRTVKGRLALQRLSLAGLDSKLRRRGVSTGRSDLGLALGIHFTPADGWKAQGEATLSGFAISEPRLAVRPVQWPAVTLAGQVRLDPRRGRLTVKRLRWQQGSAEMTLDGWAELRGRHLRGEGQVNVPATPCQNALTSLPAGLTPRLKGLRLAGALGGKLTLKVDSRSFKDLELAVAVRPAACRVVRDAPRADVSALKRPFVFVSRPPGWKPTRLVMGPERKDWVPYSRMGRYVIAAFLAAEDQRFFTHRGFDVENIRRALAEDLRRGEFAKGASSISQQVVKNVFLTHRRNLSRKLQEFVLTWRLEQVLDKRRILEIYLNMVEMGPGLFGVRAAARHYFQKEPSQLDPLQAAHLAAITPNPRVYFAKFRSGRAGMDWLLHLRWLLYQMHRIGWLDRRTYERYRYRDLRLISYRKERGVARRGPRGRRVSPRRWRRGPSPATLADRPLD